MAKFYDHIPDELQDFIRKQHVYFVASAPLSADGHVNLSPKGLDSFRVLSANEVAYLDMTGSGNETSAHLRENGRITFMFCAFTGNPLILRLYGHGETVLPGSAAWDELSPLFTLYPGTRQIIRARIETVQTSCGFAVPKMDFVEHRGKLIEWCEHKGEEGLAKYHQDKNLRSMDGLPSAMAGN